MKYALYQNQRITPTKDIKDAVCPICGELVIPKCGKIKMHHWAHKTSQNCDPWWENETEWHRKWKDHFPEVFQEYLMVDSVTGEKHIADIRTDKGFVIEFQHSSIKPKEKEAREAFYKNMVWVVDASKYYEKFKQAIESKSLHHSKINKNYFYIREDYYDNKIDFLPKLWLESSVPVLFDFGINDISDNSFDKQKGWLYCIFPEKYTKSSYCNTTYCGLYLRKESFINKVLSDSNFFSNLVLQEIEKIEEELVKERNKMLEEWRKEQEEYEKELQKQKQIKYANDKKWRDAIHFVKNAFKNNDLNLLKLYVNEDGQIIDYQKENIYNGLEAMVLSVKSFESSYQGRSYIKNELLLLINSGDKFVTGVISMPSYLLDLQLWGSYNFYIRKLDVIEHYSAYKIFFDVNDERIYSNKETRSDLEYILNKFAGVIEK